MRLRGLFVKDVALMWRNRLFAIEALIAALMVLVYHFALPDTFDTASTLYATGDDALVQAFAQAGSPGIVVTETREALEEAMRGDPTSYGIVLTMQDGRPAVELVFHGNEPERIVETAMLEVSAMLDGGGRETAEAQIRYVYGHPLDHKLPFRVTVLVALLLTEPVLLGFFFAATMIFSEKEEGTARAYSVTPGSITAFLGSKILAIILLSVLSAVIMTGLTVPGSVHWGWLAAIVVTGSFMGSALAMLLSAFFDRLSAAMMPLSVVLVLMTLPMAALFAPSISPIFMRLLPTWHQMFALRECFFPTGRTGVIGLGILYPLAIGVAAYAAASGIFVRRLKD